MSGIIIRLFFYVQSDQENETLKKEKLKPIIISFN